RQLAAEAQLTQALAEALGLAPRAGRFDHSTDRGLPRHSQALTMSSRKGSPGRAVSVSSRCPHFGQQNRRSTTSGWTFVPAPGNAATATVERAADLFQPPFAGAKRCEHVAQQMCPASAISVSDRRLLIWLLPLQDAPAASRRVALESPAGRAH